MPTPLARPASGVHISVGSITKSSNESKESSNNDYSYSNDALPLGRPLYKSPRRPSPPSFIHLQSGVVSRNVISSTKVSSPTAKGTMPRPLTPAHKNNTPAFKPLIAPSKSQLGPTISIMPKLDMRPLTVPLLPTAPPRMPHRRLLSPQRYELQVYSFILTLFISFLLTISLF